MIFSRAVLILLFGTCYGPMLSAVLGAQQGIRSSGVDYQKLSLPVLRNTLLRRHKSVHQRAEATAAAIATADAPSFDKDEPILQYQKPRVVAEKQGRSSAESHHMQKTNVTAVPERKVITALSAMFFLFTFVFSLTRDIKDTLLSTATTGSETIYFLKLYGVLPTIAVFLNVYGYLRNIMSSKSLFYSTSIPFLSFPALFSFVLYPRRSFLQSSSCAAGWLSADEHVRFLKYPVQICQNWVVALNFVVSDLWGHIGIPLLFWSFFNDIIPVEQALRHYPVMAFVGNMAPILSGTMLSLMRRVLVKKYPLMADDESFALSLKLCSALVGMAGVGIVLLYKTISDAYSLQSTALATTTTTISNSSSSTTLNEMTNSKPVSTVGSSAYCPHSLHPSRTMLNAFKSIYADPFTRKLLIVALCYSITTQLGDAVWKAALVRVFPEKHLLLGFLGRYSILASAWAVLMYVISTKWIKMLDDRNWDNVALITPVAMSLLSIPLFVFTILARGGGGALSGIFANVHGSTEDTAAAAAAGPATLKLLYAIYVGLFQRVVVTSMKFAILDPTFDSAYAVIDNNNISTCSDATKSTFTRKAIGENNLISTEVNKGHGPGVSVCRSDGVKISGKVAILALAAVLGRVGGSLILQMVLLVWENILSASPFLFICFYTLIGVWIATTLQLYPAYLGKLQQIRLRQQEKLHAARQNDKNKKLKFKWW